MKVKGKDYPIVSYILPIGSMVLLYMVCHGSHQHTPNVVSINIPAPWIRHGLWNIYPPCLFPTNQIDTSRFRHRNHHRLSHQLPSSNDNGTTTTRLLLRDRRQQIQAAPSIAAPDEESWRRRKRRWRGEQMPWLTYEECWCWNLFHEFPWFSYNML